MVVGVVIVHFESPTHLRQCLASLAGVGAHTIVVDNSPTAASRRETDEICQEAGVRLLAQPTNIGFAAACNLAVGEMQSDVDAILFVNPDARVEASTVEALSQYLDDNPTVGAVNPVIDLPDSSVWFSGGSLQRRFARVVQHITRPAQAQPNTTDWVNGCVLVVRRSAFEAVDGFDERYFLYWEDVVLSLRLREAGWDLAVIDDHSATHIRGEGGTSIDGISLPQMEHSLASRLLFIRNELNLAEKATALPYTVVNILRLAQRANLGGASGAEVTKAAGRGLSRGLR